ncbi:MAG: hypothetical protein ACQESK_05435 [Bacteroidota bacterium]
MKQKIIFSNSYSPRTGHNFVAEVFKTFLEADVLIHHRSETRIAPLLDAYFSIYDTHIYGVKDKDFFDYLFINDLRNKIISKSDKESIIIKNTSFVGIEHINRVFPNDIQILILRDPYAVLKSLFKGMSLGKRNTKNTLKKIGIFVGIYPLYYSWLFNKKIIKKIPDLNNYTVVRYEDLVIKDDNTLIKLRDMFETEKSLNKIKEDIDNIKVINTSFTNETGAKHIWEAKQKSRKFNPINRKGHNWLVRFTLKVGCYPLRKKMGYI